VTYAFKLTKKTRESILIERSKKTYFCKILNSQTKYYASLVLILLDLDEGDEGPQSHGVGGLLMKNPGMKNLLFSNYSNLQLSWT
jgi:hypothetical protein